MYDYNSACKINYCINSVISVISVGILQKVCLYSIQAERSGVMKFQLNNKYVKWGITAFAVLAATILFYYMIFHLSNLLAILSTLIDILLPVVMGLITAYLLSPVMNVIEFKGLTKLCDLLRIKKSRLRDKILRFVAIAITCVLFFAFIYVMIALLLSQIIPSIQSIVKNLDVYIDNIYNWGSQLMVDFPELGEWFISMVDRYSGELEKFLNETVLVKTSELIKTVSLSIISLLAALWDFMIGFIIAIYVLSGKEKFTGIAKKVIYALWETESANVVISNIRFVHNTFIGFVGGKIVDSIIIGILCWIGTTWLGTPYAALISLIIGVTNIIPFFGPFLGAIPCTVLIFVIDPLHPLQAVYFVLFVFLLQQLDGNVIGPKILGSSTGLESFWVIFSITLFGGLWGVPGMIIGVPLFAVIYAAVRGAVNQALRKKELPQNTELYIEVGSINEAAEFESYTPAYKRKKRNKKAENQDATESKFLINKEVYKLLKKQQSQRKSTEDRSAVQKEDKEEVHSEE